ncbi:MAG: hypothetical protein M3N00_06845 [Actinomycetota bacterium]|nr:hypothetical protein [Actinomycetota bacterium]
MHRSLDWSFWDPRFERFVARHSSQSDGAHDLTHVHRIAAHARQISASEGARLEIMLHAAWLHDYVVISKDSPQRRAASALAAQAVGSFLRDTAYPAELVPDIEHAIEAHSFSAQVAPETREAI